MSNLTLPSVNGSPAVEYRAIDGHPVPHQATIQCRTLTPSGYKYRASEWTTLTAGDVRTQVRLNGPVADWLRTQTRVDLSEVRLAVYSDEEPAYLFCEIPTLDLRERNAAQDSRQVGSVTPKTRAVFS